MLRLWEHNQGACPEAQLAPNPTQPRFCKALKCVRLVVNTGGSEAEIKAAAM